MNDHSLEQRVERLERLVEEIHSALRADGRPAALAAAPQPEPAAASLPGRVPTAPATSSTVAAPEAPSGGDLAGGVPHENARRPGAHAPAVSRWAPRLWDSELWLNKLGVGLVLFGVTFLFKYSIDQGWLTPLVRVGFGAALGVVLLGAGLRLGPQQRSLARVLMGGGIATFYIVGFAAFQLYELVGYNAAFAFMVSVTLAAFVLAVREDASLLSLIGVKGALGTPFLLYTGAGNFPWLIAYSCLVIASAVALFLLRGWRSVLWTAAVGGWAVFVVAHVNSVADLPLDQSAYRWILQGAVLFAGFAFGLLPAYWELRWGGLAGDGAEHGGEGHVPEPPLQRVFAAHLYLLTISTPLAALGLTGLAWRLSSDAWGWLVLAVAAAYAAAGGLLLRRSRLLAASHLLAAAILLPLGSVAALSGDRLYLALAAEAAVLHALAFRLRLPNLAVVAHLLLASCVIWFLVRLDVAGIAGTSRTLADLGVLVLALAASTRLATRRELRIYRFAVHVGLLAWFWRDLSTLPNGAAYVSGAWSLYALALLVVGLRRQLELPQRVALATLLLVVGKLFLVDLAALEALWRILLFLGVGSAFLLLSYLLQDLWAERPRVVRR